MTARLPAAVARRANRRRCSPVCPPPSPVLRSLGRAPRGTEEINRKALHAGYDLVRKQLGGAQVPAADDC